MARKFSEPSLLIATHNAGKLEEMRSLFAPYPITIVGGAEKNLDEPEETGTTFVENARIKAQAAVLATGLPALADDSGLEVEALGGAPGVYTADWAETPTGRDFGMAMVKTHDKLQSVGAVKPWRAAFCSTLILSWPDGHEEIFEGRAEGQLIWPIRGAQGHGYDPMFIPDGHNRTFAEMSFAEKNAISHRAAAFKKLMQACFD